MKIYDYATKQVIEISDAQYDFMEVVIKHSGRMELVLKEYPITAEQYTAWQADSVFWPVLQGHLEILYKSRGLTPELIKAHLLDTLTAQHEPTREQTIAIGQSIKALGMGLQPRQGFGGSVSVTPANTTIVFNDGLDGK